MSPRYRMALRPFYPCNPWVTSRGPLRIFDQDFGNVLDVDDLLHPIISLSTLNRHLQPRHGPLVEDSGRSRVEMDKDGYKILVGVQHFAPEEIEVKHVGDNVIVEGKHEETEDEHGYVSRHFIRRYVLPKGVDPDALTSSLSSDGILTITAPKVELTEKGKVRRISIKQTGKPAIKHVEKKAKKK
ncbi:alpha-crystallin A chain-like [Ischnura elegans]|uniref:alpha-crystallin A chain-like n=1 Tax=Ischnura elegans TaxID=197161 RepID=UPI001ED87513|nr:alpha-crystallin A chain-like [Ischnura elegans]